MSLPRRTHNAAARLPTTKGRPKRRPPSRCFLLLNGRNRADLGASAAVHARVGVDDVEAVPRRNGAHRTLALARAAANAFFVDFVSHVSHSSCRFAHYITPLKKNQAFPGTKSRPVRLTKWDVAPVKETLRNFALTRLT